jgi:UDP-glucose 4-epimerase
LNAIRKVLVTGGAGFIGSHIVEHWENRADVVVLDNLRSGHARNLQGRRCHFVEGSIESYEQVRKVCENVDVVFHLAALVSVPESVFNPELSVRLNTIGTLNVLRAAKEAGVRRVVFTSSSAIYGDNPATPKREAMVPQPTSPYAVTKLDGEYYCDWFHRQFGLSTISLRCFNVFGPRQDPNSPYAAAIPSFVEKAKKHEPVTIFGDGLQTRDFVFVTDVVRANELAATLDIPGVYNVARGESVTIKDLASTIIKLTGSRSALQLAPPRAGDVKHSLADISEFKKLGFSPSVSIEQGLRLMLDNPPA